MDALTPDTSQRRRSGINTKQFDLLALAPVFAAIAYPFILRVFHVVVGGPGQQLKSPAFITAALVMACIFAVPALGFSLALRMRSGPGARRLAYASVLAPTLYVFLGVVQAMAGSPLPDELVWSFLWIGAAMVAWSTSRSLTLPTPTAGIARWRVAHGIAGAVVLLYVLFHIGNHLFGLLGPPAHAAVMGLGRKVYRAPIVEPLLVVLLLFQIASGLYLAWKWSAGERDFHRTFQVASGFYLSVFLLGHMNSVFLYARTYLKIQTDWAFATGAPTGLIHDAWNIRLLPHYALGVFFVLAHVASGLRVVLVKHGTAQRTADRLWAACVLASAIVAAAILAGMGGIRIGAQ